MLAVNYQWHKIISDFGTSSGDISKWQTAGEVTDGTKI